MADALPTYAFRLDPDVIRRLDELAARLSERRAGWEQPVRRNEALRLVIERGLAALAAIGREGEG